MAYTVDGQTFTYRERITIGSTGKGLSGAVSNVPVSINIPSSNTSYWLHDDGNGGYVRFTNSTGTVLNFEVESYDAIGEDAWWHVKIDSIATTDTDIYIYYGDAGTPVNGENATGTWDANFKAVYHLNKDKAGGYLDDTTGSFDLTETGSTTDTTGRIDRARNIAAPNKYFDAGAITGANAEPLTIEATVNVTTLSADRAFVGRNKSWLLKTYSTGLISLLVRNSANTAWTTADSATTLSTGITYHLVAVMPSSGALRIYVDGVESTGNTISGVNTPTENVKIGRWASTSTQDMDGIMDEVTISNSDRSADWVKCRYQSGLGTWLTFRGEESLVAPTSITTTTTIPAVTITIPTVATATIAMSAVLPAPSITGIAVITPTAITATTTLPNPAIQDILIQASALAITTTLPVVTVALPSLVNTSALSVTVTVPAPDIIEQNILISVHNFPSGVSVEYKVINQQGVVLQNWTSTAILESAVITGKSSYFTQTTAIPSNSQVVVHWRTTDQSYYASESFNLYDTLVQDVYTKTVAIQNKQLTTGKFIALK